MLGFPLGKQAVVSFNNILLEMPNVDWLSQQKK